MNRLTLSLTLFIAALTVTGLFLVLFPQVYPLIRPFPKPLTQSLKHFDFNEKKALEDWGERTFKGKAIYWIEFEGEEGYVRSRAQDSASARYYKLRFDAKHYPLLSWRWRVGKFPDKMGVPDPGNRDDYPLRVFVVFLGRFFRNFHCMEYLWDNSLPEGSVQTSPFTDQIRQMVLRSGGDETGEWREEHRNVREDYRKLFDKYPTLPVRAIAIMTDSEGTRSLAEGFFDDIQIAR